MCPVENFPIPPGSLAQSSLPGAFTPVWSFIGWFKSRNSGWWNCLPCGHLVLRKARKSQLQDLFSYTRQQRVLSMLFSLAARHLDSCEKFEDHAKYSCLMHVFEQGATQMNKESPFQLATLLCKIMDEFHRWEQDNWLLIRGSANTSNFSVTQAGRHSAATQKTHLPHGVSRWITNTISVGTRNRFPALGHWQVCKSRLNLSHGPKLPSAWSACASSLKGVAL